MRTSKYAGQKGLSIINYRTRVEVGVAVFVWDQTKGKGALLSDAPRLFAYLPRQKGLTAQKNQLLLYWHKSHFTWPTNDGFSCSAAKSCLTVCDPMSDSATAAHQASLLILPCLLEFAQTHVHWISDAIHPSHPLSPHLLLPPVFPSIRVFANELTLRIRWPKYWSFSFSFSTSSDNSGLISFRIDWLISLQSKGPSRVFSSTTVRKHQFFGAQPSLRSNSHIHTWLLERPYDNGWQPSKGYQHTTPTLLPKELQYQVYIQVVQCFWRIEWLSICQAFPWNGFFLQSFIKYHFSVGWEANLMTLSCRDSPPLLHTGLSWAFKRYQCSHSHPQGSDILAWGFQ